MGRRLEDNLEVRSPDGAAEKFRKLIEGWMSEDPAYDREAWSELKEGLDRNRPEYRKHFPDDAQG